MRREHLAGDLFRHLEDKLEALGRQLEQPGPEFRRRKLVEGEIAADRAKGLRVFFQAGRLEEPPRKPAARKIVAARIDLPDPSFVLPGAAADVDALGREVPQSFRERIAIEGRRVVE
jgi:hypothetical protein